MRIAVVAPSCPLKRDAAERLRALVEARGDCTLVIHPQCFATDGHFAGPDELRLEAFREMVADPSVDAVWFARGGYGSNRIAEAAARMSDAAGGKLFLGYSDGGFLLAALHKKGRSVAHAPMPQDILRDGGEAAVGRALDWIVRRDPAALEPAIGGPAMAFNMTVLSSLLGTALQPDFDGVDLCLEEVSEHHYRIDRLMFHLTGNAAIRRVARIRLGRTSDIPPNDPDFGRDAAEIVADWCARSGIPFGGPADIGHDSDNRVVPFPTAAKS